MERNGVEVFDGVKYAGEDWCTGVGIANSDLGGFKKNITAAIDNLFDRDEWFCNIGEFVAGSSSSW